GIVTVSPPLVPAQNTLTDQEASLLLERLVQAKVAVVDAEAKYGPEHASVRLARQQQESLQKMMDEVKAVQELQAKVKNPIAANTDPAQEQVYFIGGVKRDGVYSLSGREITLRAAIISAGGPLVDGECFATIIRRTGNQQETIVRDIPV